MCSVVPDAESIALSQASSVRLSRNQVRALQVALDNIAAELADTHKQLTVVDAGRTAAAKRSSTLMTQWEEREAARDEEVSKLR